MRRTSRIALVPAALAALLVASAGPASAGPGDIVRWDTSTCASEGAASPVVVFENSGDRGFGMQYWIDGEAYTTVLAPPGTADEYTLSPVVAGEHYLQLTRGEQPTDAHVKQPFTAPECPPGSPDPSENTYPTPEPTTEPELWAAWGKPTCEDAQPTLPFTFGNTGDGDGVQVGYVDGVERARTTITAGADGSSFITLEDGTHTYEIRTEAGDVLASTTVTAPTCATGEPTASPTEDPTTPPADPSDAVPTDGPGPGGPTEPPTMEQTTPRTPAVVQTDGVSRDVSAPLLTGAGGLLVLGGAILAARRARPVRVRRRH